VKTHRPCINQLWPAAVHLTDKQCIILRQFGERAWHDRSPTNWRTFYPVANFIIRSNPTFERTQP
jgi:hypothetical protein